MARGNLDVGAAWMVQFQNGDDAAFDKIVIEYQGSVFGMLRKTLGSHSMIEDLAQEVFLRVWRARDRYQPRGLFTTWLFRIAFNLALNQIRDDSRKKAQSVQDLESKQGELPDLADNSVTQPLDEQEWSKILDEALADLPENQRVALVLQHYEGLDLAAIGEVLDISPKAVKSLLHRSREKLKAMLVHLRGREDD